MLLLAGAKLVVDADGCAGIIDHLGDGIRNFERQMYSAAPWRRFPKRYAFDRPPVDKTMLRIAGGVLIAIGMAAVALQ